jgi:large subunit ribosomal protein L35
MPKVKTHSGTKKRFKKTGSGKIVRKQSGRGHLKLAKSVNRYRRLDGSVGVAKVDAPRIEKLLGGK